MKKSCLLLILLLTTSLWAEVTNKEALRHTYERVVLHNIDTSVTALHGLEEAIRAKQAADAKARFGDLVTAWKKVRALYFLGELDPAYLDTPRLIDTFHHGNEDLADQLDLILESDDPLEIALFKNSHKSINALEYLLFTKKVSDPRVNAAMLRICGAVKTHLFDIQKGYLQNKPLFLQDTNRANALLINALSESSYKLKEWRIADVAGISDKYEGDPDLRRGEYPHSGNSLQAVKAIVSMYIQVLDSPQEGDFGDYLESILAAKNLQRIKTPLQQSHTLLAQMQERDLLTSRKLYEQLHTLHLGIYVYLIDALKMQAKILDADGD